MYNQIHHIYTSTEQIYQHTIDIKQLLLQKDDATLFVAKDGWS